MQTRPDTNASPPLTLRKSQAGSEECPAHAWLPTPAPPTLPLAGVPRPHLPRPLPLAGVPRPHPPRPSRGARGRQGGAGLHPPRCPTPPPGAQGRPRRPQVAESWARPVVRPCGRRLPSFVRETRTASCVPEPVPRALPAPRLLRPHRPWAASTWPPGSPRPAGGGGPSFQGAAGGRAHRGDRARTTASELTQSAESAVGREGAPVCRRRAREGAWSEWAVPPRPPRRPSPRAFPSGPRSNEGRRAGPEGARAGPRQRQARG